MRLPFLYTLVGLLLLGIAIMTILIKQQYAVQSVVPDVVRQGVVLPVTYPPIPPEEELKLQEQIAPLIAAGDMAACEQVKNAMYKAVCVNNITLQQVEETKDVTLCQRLDDVLMSQLLCEQSVLIDIVSVSKNIEDCNQGSRAEAVHFCKQSFYEVIASVDTNPELCDQNPDKAAAERCFNAISLRKQIDDSLATGAPDFQCSVFRGETVISECEKLKVALAANDSQGFGEICADPSIIHMKPLCSALMF